MTYTTIRNCNFAPREDVVGQTIHAARKAVEAGLTTDADLIDAMDELESTLTEYADSGSAIAVEACRDAESAVIIAYTQDVRDEIDAAREASYVD